ncbi:MAG: SMP-30/gluconolactonase/LRE family protein [Planctomycetaceae bacterium]
MPRLVQRLLLILSLIAWLSAVASAQSLIDESSELETLATEFGLADGPAWDGGSVLYVPDVKGEKLYQYRPAQAKLSVLLPEAGKISATFFNHGQLYLADNGNAAIAILREKAKEAVVTFEGEKPPRPNDLAVDNAGNVYTTLTSESRVVRVTPGGVVETVVSNIITPNGITLSPDERTLYVSAYRPKEVWAYDLAGVGDVSASGKLLAKMDDGDALGADGMTIDRAGNIYCAGATDIWIWSPSGKLLHKIACPTRPINCAFGDPDLQSLYITGFGGLYRQRMNISGRSPQPHGVLLQQRLPDSAEPTGRGGSQPSTVIRSPVAERLDIEFARYGDRRLLMDIFRPSYPVNVPLPCVVVVHGGGWLKGDKSKFRAIAIELAARGYVTAAIEYRLGGEAEFPAAIHDCNAAVRFLRANASELLLDPNAIGAVGGSAGGHLVGLMATGPDVPELQGTGGNQAESSRLQAAIVMAGPLEIATGSVAERSLKDPASSNSNRWLGGSIAQVPEAYHLADAAEKISANTPPILFMVGELDNPERNAAARERLRAAGVWTDVRIYPDGKHGCWNQEPWFSDMAADMDTFFKEHLPVGQ